MRMNFLNVPFEIPRSVADATTKTLFVVGAGTWGDSFIQSLLPNPATFGLALQAFLLASVGGFVRELLSEGSKTWKTLASHIFVAGFMGMLIGWLCTLINMNSILHNVVVAMSGLQGPFVATVLKKWFKGLLKSVLRETEGVK